MKEKNMNNKPLERVEEILRSLESISRDRYKAEIIGIFGSYVRKEQKKGSDIDILVKFEKGATLFDFIGLADFLEQNLKIKVDIVPVDTIRKEIKEQVLKEAIYL